MKRRYYFLIVVLLLIGAAWGFSEIVRVSVVTPPAPSANSIVTPEVPAAAMPTTDVVVDAPMQGQLITSPVSIIGKAKGNWFFEGSFPISLYNMQGQAIATGVAQAQGDWMTTNYVPFTANLAFPSASHGTGYLLLKNDNPSGNPQFDKSLTINVQW
ncbi:MAG: hypothetical protein JWM92_5 [Candidatus Nomurabacteria bacterium]|jgi:hypothetical protein|nr:hypothetical protein [Candidatus Nomurabacteria bacterium]